VRELLRRLVPHVAEADRVRHPVDLALVAREEVPALGGPPAPVALEVGLLLARGQLGPFRRVEAHGHDLELLARRKVQPLERDDHPVQNLVAQHRALIVDEREDDGPVLLEELAEPHLAPGLVAQHGVERQLLVQALLDADLLQHLRRPALRHPALRRPAVLRRSSRQ
jgi:hypothetical protein